MSMKARSRSLRFLLFSPPCSIVHEQRKMAVAQLQRMPTVPRPQLGSGTKPTRVAGLLMGQGRGGLTRGERRAPGSSRRRLPFTLIVIVREHCPTAWRFGFSWLSVEFFDCHWSPRSLVPLWLRRVAAVR